MSCYCSNYYGAVNCQNRVPQFGQRCKLCTVLNEGTPTKNDIFRITSNDYAYDSEAIEEDDSSREEVTSHRRRMTRQRSKSSSK
ncbi:hypothetical protein F5Y04DRAFT_260322 [Hypomontagnella monticulosa]|nr:hypothetical protein F5Y04DRAFT_260322 [Hypomontagnella monticulosa]